MSNTRNHHYVSQFYLRGFTESGRAKEQLFVYDKSQNKTFKTVARNIASQRDFFRITHEENPNILEDEFAKIEARISVSLKEITENIGFPTNEQLENILFFMASIALRNPKNRHMFDGFYKQIFDLITNMICESEEIYISQCKQAGMDEDKIISYEKYKEFVQDKSRYTIEINQEVHIRAELELLNHLYYVLSQRNWCLIVSNEGIGEFLTSDYPVSLIPNFDPGPYGVGYGLKNTEVFFPISKHLAFIGMFEEIPSINNMILANEGILNNLNDRTHAFAHKQVYSGKKFSN